MKTAQQQIDQWALDEIPFRLDERSAYVILDRGTLERIAEAIHDNNASVVVEPVNRMFAVEMMDWETAKLLHIRAKKVGVKITARFLLQFDGLRDAYHYLGVQPRVHEDI